MEDMLLIMKSQNIMSSMGILDGEQYKFFYTNNKEFLYNRKVIRCRNVVKDNSIQTFFVFDEYSFENLYINNTSVICYNIEFCKHYNSTDVISKEFNTREVLNNRGELKTLKLKRYECKKYVKRVKWSYLVFMSLIVNFQMILKKNLVYFYTMVIKLSDNMLKI